MVTQRSAKPQELQPASQRIGYVYLEKARVHRDQNAITATDKQGEVHIPAASLATVLLGPGTRITHQAVSLLADSGTSIVWVGQEGVRYYAHGQSQARSAHLLLRQAKLVSNRHSRLRVAREMYTMRFPGEDVSGLTMQQLRGREGARIRNRYREESRRTGVPWSRRNYDPSDWSAGDPVNRALSAANSSLYGLAHSVIVALGCSPGLGFVHTGHTRAFVYDIADLYKAEITIPVAFEVVAEGDHSLGSRTRRELRDRVKGSRLLERMVRDIRHLLEAEHDPDAEEDFTNPLALWDDKLGEVEAGVSYRIEEIEEEEREHPR